MNLPSLSPETPRSIKLSSSGLPTELSPAVIAIDGPAASGKSTIGFRLSELTNFLFFDTGIMYRAVTHAVLGQEIDPKEQEAVGKVAEEIQIDIRSAHSDGLSNPQNNLFVNGQDVTHHLRTPEVDQNVSFIAANPTVREALTAQQRRIALEYGEGSGDKPGGGKPGGGKPGIVMVGRDIGTVVVPEAPVKLYLEATAEARAQRRYLEQSQQGKPVEYEQVLADIRTRDQRDSQRTHAPLRAAGDAIVIDTSDLTVDEVVAQIMQNIKR